MTGLITAHIRIFKTSFCFCLFIVVKSWTSASKRARFDIGAIFYISIQVIYMLLQHFQRVQNILEKSTELAESNSMDFHSSLRMYLISYPVSARVKYIFYKYYLASVYGSEDHKRLKNRF